MDDTKLQQLLEKANQLRESAGEIHDCSQIFAPAYEALEVPAGVQRVVHRSSLDGYESWIPSLFPPCGMPLWITYGGSLVCEWRHWFLDRKVVIADFDLESSTATERARSYSQLGYLIVQNLLEIEDEVTPEIEQVCRHLGIDDLDDVEQIWEDAGDLASGFAAHEQFRNDLPQACFNSGLDEYEGDFPANRSTGFANLDRTCSFELHGRFRAGIAVLEPRREAAASPDSPLWLRTDDQNEAFRRLLSEENYAGAWLSLCSSGWTYGAAKEAIDQLADKQDDLRFKIQASCWSALPFEDVDRY